MTAATTDRDAVVDPRRRQSRARRRAGSRPRPEPASARTPSRRITHEGYRRVPPARTYRTYLGGVPERSRRGQHPAHRRPAGSAAQRVLGARRRRSRCYTPRRPRHLRNTAIQEVSDRARGRRIGRPVRRTRAFDKRSGAGAPAQRGRCATQVPGAPARGLFVCPGDSAARSPLMPATVIVGLQWGDEGKGKTTDFLAEQVAMVVRYQGGDNAGHTVVSGDEVFKLHLTPSGVLYPHITSVIGNGVVVNPATLIDELDMLAARGIDVEPRPGQPQRARDHAVPRGARPGQRGPARRRARSGTTGRGIGPTYGDRAWRLGPADGGPARPRRSSASGSRASCPTRTSLLAVDGRGRRSRSSRSSSRRSAWGERLRAAPRRHDVARPGRARRAASTCCSRAPRARCSTSTTAATRS